MDRIKIVVRQRLNKTVLLKNPLVKSSDNIHKRNNFNIYSKADKRAFMTVVDNGKEFYVFGSIRKWYFGRGSLEDLSGQQATEAFASLAEILGVSFDDIRQARLLNVEFGYNIFLEVQATTVLDKVTDFKNNRSPSSHASSLQFRMESQDYWFVMYDKEKENEDNDNLPGSEYNCLRIEFKAFSYNSIRKLFYGAETIGDFLDNYMMIIVRWMNMFRKVKMEPAVLSMDNKDFHGKTVKFYNNYLAALGIKTLGLRKAYKYIEQLKLTTKRKSAIRIRSKNLIRKFENKKTYGQQELLNEVISQIKPRFLEEARRRRGLIG